MRCPVFAVAAALALAISPVASYAQSCKSFSTCEEAMRSFKNGNSKLDGDGDGVPCEKLCGGGGSSKSATKSKSR